ncbi:MAG: hypothetical protein HY926_02105 [Elusimicrobia bacterium]|nr:hypothetical protein [Elusimicrobiota bacterium]
MNEMIRLELRKQRLAFIGLAGAFIITIPLAWFGAAIGHVDRRSAIDAAFLFWTLVGLPASAALLGASAGAGLRAEPAAPAESILPVSPGRRASAALIAAALQLAALAAVVLLIAIIVSPGWRTTFTEKVWSAPEFQRAAFRLMGFSLAYILSVSFAAAFALGHGLAGGLLGLGLAGIGSTALAAAVGLQTLYPERDILRPGGVLFVAAIAVGGTFYSLRRAASRLERRGGLGWKDFALCGLGLAAGAALCVLTMGGTFERLVRRPQPVWREEYFARAQRQALRLVPGLREAAGQGLLAANMEGELLLLKPDGSRRTLVPGTRTTIQDIFDVPLLDRNHSVQWESDGALWSLHSRPRHTSDNWNGWDRALMHGRPGERFQQLPLASEGNWQLAHRGPRVGLLGWAGDGKMRFTPLAAQGRGRPQPVDGELPKLFADGWAEAGLAAAVGPDRRSVSWRGRTWKLPGWFADGVFFELSLLPAVARGEAPVFAVNVWEKSDVRSLVLCRPGGRVETPWPGAHFYAEGITADGTLWDTKDNRTMLMLRPDGSAAPVLDLSAALAALPKAGKRDRKGPPRFPILLKVEDGAVWVVLRQSWLARVDAGTGELKESWRLPARPARGKDSVQAVDGGFFLHDGERIWFVDWEGKAKKLV